VLCQLRYGIQEHPHSLVRTSDNYYVHTIAKVSFSCSTGMFTVSDIIHLIQYYYQSTSYEGAAADVERFRLESIRGTSDRALLFSSLLTLFLCPF
jgi:hypothetical protein